MLIAELLPEQTPATVEVVWRDTSAAYLWLENQVEGSNSERRLNSEFRYLVKVHNSTAFCVTRRSRIWRLLTRWKWTTIVST